MSPVISEEAAKAKARALREGLQAMGVRIKHSQSLDLISRIERMSDWSTLNARQRKVPVRSECFVRGNGSVVPGEKPAMLEQPLQRVRYVGEENLLPGHVLVDQVPVSRCGDTRKTALYDAMRVCGTPSIYVHEIVARFQEAGGFSAPEPSARPTPPTGGARWDDDTEPCNRYGGTRLDVLLDVLKETRLGAREVNDLVAEFRARSGLVPAFALAD